MRIHIISQIQWTPYFKRSAHFERKNLQMKDDLSELDDFFTVIKLHYLKEMIIPKLSNTKFGLVEVTETTNIQGSFHLHSCSAKELVLKICQNSLKETCTKVFFFKSYRPPAFTLSKNKLRLRYFHGVFAIYVKCLSSSPFQVKQPSTVYTRHS